MMNRYRARRSPWRTPVLMLKFVFSPSGVSTTAEVYEQDGAGVWRHVVAMRDCMGDFTCCFGG